MFNGNRVDIWTDLESKLKTFLNLLLRTFNVSMPLKTVVCIDLGSDNKWCHSGKLELDKLHHTLQTTFVDLPELINKYKLLKRNINMRFGQPRKDTTTMLDQ